LDNTDTFLYLKYGWKRNEWPSKAVFQELEETYFGRWVLFEWAIDINYAYQLKSIEDSCEYVEKLHETHSRSTLLDLCVQNVLSRGADGYTKEEILEDFYQILMIADEIENG
jgi:hypothetical protein